MDDRCSIYDERPLICRTHGLPTLVREPGRPGTVQGCPLNFTTATPPGRSVLDLGAVTSPLSVMATMWDGTGARVELAALARADDPLDEA